MNITVKTGSEEFNNLEYHLEQKGQVALLGSVYSVKLKYTNHSVFGDEVTFVLEEVEQEK